MNNIVGRFNVSVKYSLLALVVILFSCNKYLDVEPKDQITADALFSSTNNADLFLNNIYAGIQGPFSTYDPTENFTDNSMNGVNGTASRVLYSPSVYTASNAPSYWGFYNQIRASNLFIAKVTASSLEDVWKKQRLAEARYLRAYFYQVLWTHYGGVPIITDVLNQAQGDEIFRSRNTDEETFKFISDECAAIAVDLPVQAEAGRATKGAALALKAKVLFFEASPLFNSGNDMNRWKTAVDALQAVIDMAPDAGYGLYPNYRGLFLPENENLPFYRNGYQF